MPRRVIAALLLTVGLLAGCETIGAHVENARTALRIFCRLHRADIFSVLLTDAQKQAGTIVCQAVGLGLGDD